MVITLRETEGNATVVVDGVPYDLDVHTAEEGGYWAEVRSMPGCFSQGDTADELEENVTDAIRCALAFAEDTK